MDVLMGDADAFDELFLGDVEIDALWPCDAFPWEETHTLEPEIARNGSGVDSAFNSQHEQSLRIPSDALVSLSPWEADGDALRPQNARRGRSQGLRYTAKQRKVLHGWMDAHVSDPYLSPEDRTSLASVTGLSEKQVAVYITNFRRRKLSRNDVKKTTCGDLVQSDGACGILPAANTSSTGRLDGMQKPPSQTSRCGLSNASIEACVASPVASECDDHPSSATHLDSGDSGPCSVDQAKSLQAFEGGLLEWYLATVDLHHIPDASCTETLETDSWNAYAQASRSTDGLTAGIIPGVGHSGVQVAGKSDLSTPVDDLGIQWPSMGEWPSSWPDFQAELVPYTSADYQVLSFASGSLSSAGSAADMWSNFGSNADSMGSRGSFASYGPRRGRRAYGAPKRAPQRRSEARTGRSFHCVECGQMFSTAYARKRHIESIHDPKVTWVCRPVHHSRGSPACPLCNKPPEKCRHRMQGCWEKEERERTFYRKDTMIQHYKHAHRRHLPHDDKLLQLLERHSHATEPMLAGFVGTGMPRTKLVDHVDTAAPQSTPPAGEQPANEPTRAHIPLYCRKLFAKFYRKRPRDEVDRAFHQCFQSAIDELKDPVFCRRLNEVHGVEMTATATKVAQFSIALPNGRIQQGGHKSVQIKVVYGGEPQQSWTRRRTDAVFLVVFLRRMFGKQWKDFRETCIRTAQWQLEFSRCQAHAPEKEAASKEQQHCAV